MKSKIIFCAAVMGLACSASFGAEVTPAERPVNQWDLGPEIYYSNYKESDFDVEIDGVMYGIAGAFTHHNPNHLMFKVDGHGAWGQMDYASTASGAIDGLDDYVLEGRVVAGYDIQAKEGLFFTPFFGLGYRYLNDDSSGRISSKGAAGYERESSYLYSPIGAEIEILQKGGWMLGFSAEYDILWSGEQKSHLEDVSSGFTTISNDQDSGYGVRGAVKVQKKGEPFDILIEPFIRWWKVEDSQVSNVTFTGAIVGYAYEPRNEAFETGVKIAILF